MVSRRGHWLQTDWTGSTYADRVEAITPLLAGRNVLDIGAASGLNRPDWVHAGIARVASRVVGIDIDADKVAAARARGYDLRKVNAEGFDLGESFDVVFAGELIEHLADFSSFLRCAKAHLKPAGRLVLTTPNAFALSNFIYRWGGKARIHQEHTCWFCEDTLTTLLRREGFAVETLSYLPHKTPGLLRSIAAGAVRTVLPVHLAWRTILVSATVVPGAA